MTTLALFPSCPLPGCGNPVSDPREPCDGCAKAFGAMLRPADGPAVSADEYAATLADRDSGVAAILAERGRIAAGGGW
jgi:hypothetical protein